MMTHSFKPALPLTSQNAYWAAPLFFVLSIAALVVSAKIQVPMLPVPITLQTAVVLMLPVIFGWQMALATLAAYFTAGFVGLPVFALGAMAGPAYFFGPTGGFLAGFALSVLFIGVALKYTKPTMVHLFGLMLMGHAIILASGTLWLAYGLPSLGLSAAVAAGFTPFIIGSFLKSGIASAFSRYITKA